MGLLEVAGPIMVGPSSSHTLGALKIARFAYKLMGIPEEVTFVLHGSFALTYKGHGTDRALLAGIVGLKPDDTRVKDAFAIAQSYGLKFNFEVSDLGEVHPNTVLVKAKRGNIYNEVRGSSVGGGAIKINQINGVDCDLTGEFPTLVILNRDLPGALRGILECITYNIANVYLRRVNALEGLALTIIELDSNIDDETLKKLRTNKYVLEIYNVKSEEGENLGIQ